MRAGWMRPSAISRSIDCARDLAAERVEARQDDGARRVVDDQVDAGGLLEGADVPPLAADDAALHVVAGQVDDRDGGLDGVLGGAALDGLGDDGVRAVGGLLARLGLEPLDQVGGVASRVGLDLLEQHLPRLVGRQAGHALELALLRATSCFVARRARLPDAARARRAPRRGAAGPARAVRSPAGARSSAASLSEQRLLGVRDLAGDSLAGVPLGLDAQLVRPLLGLEQRPPSSGCRPRARRRAGSAAPALRPGRPFRPRCACRLATQ